ncbi:nucleotide sugar dehydrogenase [Sphingomonas sp. IC-11]|uniref:nucleotide sugar dehydrogenase n=1 Tax=Sphingomonas sp. IC-11 TaxID=2898528 RepID=UPI001E4AD22B|nr:nucleotide sugar dehydrogenase [Sphingomonas sp. IC-11]MCD2317563.1 nucleotide sugar dehydrogenase [Sphingomonas sp. IC-11]
MRNDEKIAVIGLGYVGLPVAVALAEAFEDVVGFDVSERRVAALQAGSDWTHEIDDERLAASGLRISGDAENLRGCSFYIVTVPTPIDDALQPDLSPVESACRQLGEVISPGCAIVFESTVYPGVTEDVCGPLIEQVSGLKRGVDFWLGYSPERINPGDKEHRLETITKIIAAEDEKTLARLRTVYGSIVQAGLHEAPSIKVAEAAKVLENTQRDLNIALMNELALILDRMNVRTRDVLDAAGTKWNFLKFSPGLVGGHCIGVDPYYLTHASEKMGYHPEVILAGRRVNNGMGAFIASKALTLVDKAPATVRIGVLGLTFKEDVPDLRNSKVPDIITALHGAGATVFVHDPMADAAEAKHEYGLDLSNPGEWHDIDVLVFAVPHGSLKEKAQELIAELRPALVMDVRSFLAPSSVPVGISYWSL